MLKNITLLITICIAAFNAQANVFQVNGIDLEFSKFNAQQIRSYAVDVATKRGFEKLLQNIIPSEYNVAEIISSIDLKKVDVVEKLNIIHEINVTGKYKATFDILYNKQVIKQILQEQRIPFIQETMGNVLLLPIQQTDDQEYLVFENTNQLKDLLFEDLKDSLLINPILAKGDLDEITTYNAQNILDDNNKSNIIDLAKKYNTDKAIIVFLQNNNYQDQNLYQVTLKFINFKNLQEESFIVLGQDIKQVTGEITGKIKTIWQSKNLLEFNKPKRFLAKINTAESLENLYATVDKLKNLKTVSTVQIMQLTTQYAFVQTDFYGTPQEFLESAKQANISIYQDNNKQWLIERLSN
jgi:hypothetical protein